MSPKNLIAVVVLLGLFGAGGYFVFTKVQKPPVYFKVLDMDNPFANLRIFSDEWPEEQQPFTLKLDPERYEVVAESDIPTDSVVSILQAIGNEDVFLTQRGTFSMQPIGASTMATYEFVATWDGRRPNQEITLTIDGADIPQTEKPRD